MTTENIGKLIRALSEFAIEKKFQTKGKLSVALIVTRHAKTTGLPLDSNELVAESGSQIKGAGGPAIAKILKDHGIERILASEGGRTNRGSVGDMKDYVAFLNESHKKGIAEIDEIEKFWIKQVNAYFAAKPLRLSLDALHSVKSILREVLQEAVARQKDSPGSTICGTVLQHLVGAKLATINPKFEVIHHSASTADQSSKRQSDFRLGDVAIHVTTAPSEALIQKCSDNLKANLRPLIITLTEKVKTAADLAENKDIQKRVEIFDIEQFVAANVYERGEFSPEKRKTAIVDLISKYNQIISEYETDQGLKIEIK